MIQRGIRPTGQGSKTTTTEKTKVSVWVGSGWRCCAESAGETVFDPVTHSAEKCVRAGVKVWRYDVRSRSDTHTHTDCTHSGVFVLDASHPVTFLEDATWRHFILTKDQCVLSAVNPKPHSDIINLGVWMDVTDVLWAQVWSDLGVYFLPDDAIEDPQHELTWIWEP